MRVPITAGIKKWDMFSRDATAASCAKKQAIQTRINKGTLMLLHTTQLHCFPIIVEFYSLTMSLYLCADVYLMALARYLHWNPVRARLVSRPEDWAWSSHRAFLGMAQNDWLFQKEVLSAFGSKGVGGLVEFLGDPSALGPHPEFYKPERFPVLSNSAGSVRIPAGQEPSRRGGSWELPRGRMGLKRIGDTLSSAWGLPTEQVLGKGGERNVSRVREEICFAATHFFHYPSIKIAQYLGVSPSGVTRMMRRAQKDLWTDKTHLQRIKGLLLLG